MCQDSDVSNEELKKLSNTNQELREDVSRLQSMLEEEEERHLVQTRRLREEMRGVHDKQKQQVVALESSHKVRRRGGREGGRRRK